MKKFTAAQITRWRADLRRSRRRIRYLRREVELLSSLLASEKLELETAVRVLVSTRTQRDIFRRALEVRGIPIGADEEGMPIVETCFAHED